MTNSWHALRQESMSLIIDNPYLITHTCIEWSLNPHPLGVGDFGEKAVPLGQLLSGPILDTLIIHV